MAVSKNDAFQADEVQLAAWSRALAHPARIAILKVLAARNTCICGEIVEALPLAQATVSQHLKALKAAGLVVGEIDGPRSCYCLDQEALQRFRQAFEDLFGAINEAAACC